jgi:hypothetical protein
MSNAALDYASRRGERERERRRRNQVEDLGWAGGWVVIVAFLVSDQKILIKRVKV